MNRKGQFIATYMVDIVAYIIFAILVVMFLILIALAKPGKDAQAPINVAAAELSAAGHLQAVLAAPLAMDLTVGEAIMTQGYLGEVHRVAASVLDKTPGGGRWSLQIQYLGGATHNLRTGSLQAPKHAVDCPKDTRERTLPEKSKFAYHTRGFQHDEVIVDLKVCLP
jgi:hypothetical protein